MNTNHTEDKVAPKSNIQHGWLPKDRHLINLWIARLRKRVKDNPSPLIPPIASFKEMVDNDPQLWCQANLMFKVSLEHKMLTPLGQPGVQDFNEFLVLLNAIMGTAPEAYQDVKEQAPAGLIGFPINALLNWPMGTDAGYQFFSNQLVNIQLKDILTFWSKFLQTTDSRYVLVEKPHMIDPTVMVAPWLGPVAKKEMVSVAQAALGQLSQGQTPDSFEKVFNCDTTNNDPYLGFTSWDDFFTRTFCDGVRPVVSPDDDSVIANACESAPLQVVTGVKATDTFYLKGQAYSLNEILNCDERVSQFVGGTVYQAFLSAFSYHRWHTPVSGVVKKVNVVSGTYYLSNRYQGFNNPNGADPSAPNNSQPFLSAVATRAIIFIEADNPSIGLMCVVPIGMAEVSSCQVTVKEGDRLKKGDPLGMFHFGGSTHCLLFRPSVKLDFDFYGETPGLDAPNNIAVRAKLATVVPSVP